MTPPDDSTFWSWAAGIFAGLTMLIFKSQNDKISGIERQAKEDHEAHDREISRQRLDIAAIFERMDQNARRSEDRHVELLNAVHQSLDRKADR